MRLKKFTNFSDIPDGTRILVTICIPEDNRNEMYTGTVVGNLINYDDGKTDFFDTIRFYMNNGWTKVYGLEV